MKEKAFRASGFSKAGLLLFLGGLALALNHARASALWPEALPFERRMEVSRA